MERGTFTHPLILPSILSYIMLLECMLGCLLNARLPEPVFDLCCHRFFKLNVTETDTSVRVKDVCAEV